MSTWLAYVNAIDSCQRAVASRLLITYNAGRRGESMATTGLPEVYSQVFVEHGLADDSAASLKARTQLILAIKEIITRKGWSQAQAAEKLGVQQPRVSEIMTLRIDKFSLDLLIKYLDRLGKEVRLAVKTKPKLLDFSP